MISSDVVLELCGRSEPFRLAMERTARAVAEFTEAMLRIPGGWEALRKAERKYAIHQRRIGIELRRRDRRRKRAGRPSTAPPYRPVTTLTRFHRLLGGITR